MGCHHSKDCPENIFHSIILNRTVNLAECPLTSIVTSFSFQLINLVSPLALGILIANNILFSLCLYQMVVNPTKLSQYRLFKFIAEFIAVTIEHFLILNTSEQVDDCNVLMRQAITNSGWHKCTNRTRRDICMLLRRVQIPNYLKCTGGAIVASRIFFLKLVKLSYSFVNFMRLKSIEQ